MWIIAGLGNPGSRYDGTRHNIGFELIDALGRQNGAMGYQNNFHADTDKIRLNGETVLLLKPNTFMNLSGKSVQAAAAFFKVKPENILVIHDDLDIPLGLMRVKKGGGHGGHNGLRDISAKLGNTYGRIRMGIGRPQHRGAEASFVLSRYDASDLVKVEEQIQASIVAIKKVIADGYEAAQMDFNQKKKKKPEEPRESQPKPERLEGDT
jgi:PTH1 family peptidyl-tRNA hydrolase